MHILQCINLLRGLDHEEQTAAMIEYSESHCAWVIDTSLTPCPRDWRLKAWGREKQSICNQETYDPHGHR